MLFTSEALFESDQEKFLPLKIYSLLFILARLLALFLLLPLQFEWAALLLSVSVVVFYFVYEYVFHCLIFNEQTKRQSNGIYQMSKFSSYVFNIILNGLFALHTSTMRNLALYFARFICHFDILCGMSKAMRCVYARARLYMCLCVCVCKL